MATLFDVYGHATFRRYERDALTRVVASHPAAVISTAGGIVVEPTTLTQLLAQTHVVWVRATPAEHMRRVREQGDLRPMSHNPDAMNDLVAILNARAAEYAQAHAQLDTSGKTIEQSLNELGEIETPILLTSTLNIFRVADSLIDYMLQLDGNHDVRSINPLVGETNDGVLNDIQGRHSGHPGLVVVLER